MSDVSAVALHKNDARSGSHAFILRMVGGEAQYLHIGKLQGTVEGSERRCVFFRLHEIDNAFHSERRSLRASHMSTHAVTHHKNVTIRSFQCHVMTILLRLTHITNDTLLENIVNIGYQAHI